MVRTESGQPGKAVAACCCIVAELCTHHMHCKPCQTVAGWHLRRLSVDRHAESLQTSDLPDGSCQQLAGAGADVAGLIKVQLKQLHECTYTSHHTDEAIIDAFITAVMICC